MRPDGPSYQNNCYAGQSDLGRTNAEPIVFWLTFPNVEEVGKEADEECHLSGPSSCGVEIKDALDKAHGALLRSDEECRIGGHNHQQDGDGAEDDAFGHAD